MFVEVFYQRNDQNDTPLTQKEDDPPAQDLYTQVGIFLLCRPPSAAAEQADDAREHQHAPEQPPNDVGIQCPQEVSADHDARDGGKGQQDNKRTGDIAVGVHNRSPIAPRGSTAPHRVIPQRRAG